MTTRLPFVVSVEGVGEFTFRHADMADAIGIEARALRITGGPTEDKDLLGWAIAIARIEVLMEASPEGWDLAAIDPEDKEEYMSILLVHARLREAQERFRAELKAKRVPAGQGTKQEPGVPVPPAVQPPAD